MMEKKPNLSHETTSKAGPGAVSRSVPKKSSDGHHGAAASASRSAPSSSVDGAKARRPAKKDKDLAQSLNLTAGQPDPLQLQVMVISFTSLRNVWS